MSGPRYEEPFYLDGSTIKKSAEAVNLAFDVTACNCLNQIGGYNGYISYKITKDRSQPAR
jgi:hypothetical protein